MVVGEYDMKFKQIEIDSSIWREEIQNRNRILDLAGRNSNRNRILDLAGRNHRNQKACMKVEQQELFQ